MTLAFNEDWEFNVLGLYNFTKPGPLESYFAFLRDNHMKMEGDIVEAGVYRGRSLLATALFLKQLGSDKRVYGFDSFAGFPPAFHEKDDVAYFDTLLKDGIISPEHHARVQRNVELRRFLNDGKISADQISTSGNFADTSRTLIERKAEFLGLDNIVLIDGPFAQTMTRSRKEPERICALLIDCDLYDSYHRTYEFAYPRMVPGAFAFVDEYYSLKFPGGRAATLEFLADKPERMQMAPQKPGDFERWYFIKA